MPNDVCVNVQRVQKQHSSLVVVIPILVRRALDIKAGDYVVFSNVPDSEDIVFFKFIAKGADDDRSDANHDRADQDRGA